MALPIRTASFSSVSNIGRPVKKKIDYVYIHHLCKFQLFSIGQACIHMEAYGVPAFYGVHSPEQFQEQPPKGIRKTGCGFDHMLLLGNILTGN